LLAPSTVKDHAMTAQRASAHARVTKTLRDLGPAKLLPSEQARIRLAADTLLFCADLDTDLAARSTIADIGSLCRHLAGSGRWMPQRADELLDDVCACGPLTLGLLTDAA
jgi:hypothetical protein